MGKVREWSFYTDQQISTLQQENCIKVYSLGNPTAWFNQYTYWYLWDWGNRLQRLEAYAYAYTNGDQQ